MRTLAVALALALLAVVGGASVATAQTSPLGPAVSIEGDQTEGKVTVERASSFRFTVRNNSTTSGTPLDAQDRADVEISIDGKPADWQVSVTTPQPFQLARGEQATIELHVSVPPESAATEATLTVVATLRPVTSNVPPILGPVQQPPAQDSATLRLTVENSFTRNVMETLGPWIYVLLLLLVAAIVVAIAVAVAARRTLIRLTADARELAVPPGGKVAFAFQVESLAKDTDTALLQVSAVPEGWAAFLPVPELVLEPGQPQEVSLVVIAPRGTAQGTRQAILVTATSAKAPRGAANLEFVATVEGIEELPTAPRRAK